jgi:hypothetical protein
LPRRGALANPPRQQFFTCCGMTAAAGRAGQTAATAVLHLLWHDCGGGALTNALLQQFFSCCGMTAAALERPFHPISSVLGTAEQPDPRDPRSA